MQEEQHNRIDEIKITLNLPLYTTNALLLRKVILRHQHRILQELITLKVDLDDYNPTTYRNPLVVAAHCNNEFAFQLLIDTKVTVTPALAVGELIPFLIKKRQNVMLKSLLQSDMAMDIDSVDIPILGIPLIAHAISTNNLEALIILIEVGANVNAKFRDITPLDFAEILHRTEMIAVLTKAGGKPA
ncbi:MAG: hypothetical protein R3E32_22345 [Chitinophagales bacterium]